MTTTGPPVGRLVGSADGRDGGEGDPDGDDGDGEADSLGLGEDDSDGLTEADPSSTIGGRAGGSSPAAATRDPTTNAPSGSTTASPSTTFHTRIMVALSVVEVERG